MPARACKDNRPTYQSPCELTTATTPFGPYSSGKSRPRCREMAFGNAPKVPKANESGGPDALEGIGTIGPNHRLENHQAQKKPGRTSVALPDFCLSLGSFLKGDPIDGWPRRTTRRSPSRMATSLARTAILHKSPPFTSGTSLDCRGAKRIATARACSNSHCVSANDALIIVNGPDWNSSPIQPKTENSPAGSPVFDRHCHFLPGNRRFQIMSRPAAAHLLLKSA